MADKLHDLKHHLAWLAKLPPNSPTDYELRLVIQDIQAVKSSRRPTNDDWLASAKKHCPGFGTYVRLGQDHSDITSLLDQLLVSQPHWASGQK